MGVLRGVYVQLERREGWRMALIYYRALRQVASCYTLVFGI